MDDAMAGKREIELLKGQLDEQLARKQKDFSSELQRERYEAEVALERFKNELTFNAEMRRSVAAARVQGLASIVGKYVAIQQAFAEAADVAGHPHSGYERVIEIGDRFDALALEFRRSSRRDVPSTSKGDGRYVQRILGGYFGIVEHGGSGRPTSHLAPSASAAMQEVTNSGQVLIQRLTLLRGQLRPNRQAAARAA